MTVEVTFQLVANQLEMPFGEVGLELKFDYGWLCGGFPSDLIFMNQFRGSWVFSEMFFPIIWVQREVAKRVQTYRRSGGQASSSLRIAQSLDFRMLNNILAAQGSESKGK